MLNLEKLYANYNEQTFDDLRKLINITLQKRGFLTNLINKINNAIDFIKNHKTDCRHNLRLVLILLYEYIYDIDSIFGAILHDFHEPDNYYAYNKLCNDYGSKILDIIQDMEPYPNETLFSNIPEKVNPYNEYNDFDIRRTYSSLINNIAENPSLFFVICADRLDHLLTSDGIEEQKLIKETINYFLPTLQALNSHNRFLSLIADAVYKCNEPAMYKKIQKHINNEHIFEFASKTYECLITEYEKNFKNIIMFPPTIYEISKISEPSSVQSKIIYDVFLLTDIDTIPTTTNIIKDFIKNEKLKDFIITQIYEDGFEFEDQNSNIFKIIITTYPQYTSYQYGNNLTLYTSHSSIFDDLQNKIIVYTSYTDDDPIDLPEGSTIFDLLIELNNDNIEGILRGNTYATRNGKKLKLNSVLNDKDRITINDINKTDISTQLESILSVWQCKTEYAKQQFCKYIQDKFAYYEKQIAKLTKPN